MPSGIHIDTSRLKASLRRMERDLKRPATVYGRAARHMRDYVRETITMQGRKRKYTPLSHWTRARTGRRKALITMRPFIKASWDAKAGVVYFDQTDKAWHLDQHHTGFISPPVDLGGRKRMVVPKASGGVLAAFTKRKASKIPGREIWPTQKEVNAEVTGMFATWVDGLARKNWR